MNNTNFKTGNLNHIFYSQIQHVTGLLHSKAAQTFYVIKFLCNKVFLKKMGLLFLPLSFYHFSFTA